MTTVSDPYPPEFTIAFVAHGDVELLDLVVPATITALCEGTSRSYDLVLVVDGATPEAAIDIYRRAQTWGIDEVRLRRRDRHHAAGDPSNNGHAHLHPLKGRFLITFEGDVAAFRVSDGDALAAIARIFDTAPSMALATRIDDHDCWQWPLREVGPLLAPHVRSVNRVASHMLIYDLPRYHAHITTTGAPPFEAFHDDEGGWFNWEDWLSTTFAVPDGPGIGYLDDLPVQVFHCDRKIAPGSPYYERDLTTRLNVFHQRHHETQHLRTNRLTS